jgi:hypothetical protein
VYVGGRKIGLERVKDQEKRQEQENHNVGRSDIGSERVKCRAVIASTICRTVHTEYSLLDVFRQCGAIQDNTGSYDICSPEERG